MANQYCRNPKKDPVKARAAGAAAKTASLSLTADRQFRQADSTQSTPAKSASEGRRRRIGQRSSATRPRDFGGEELRPPASGAEGFGKLCRSREAWKELRRHPKC